ncbi:MAG: calcium/sodium antiporter [Armatimonadota bacterium]
MGHYLLFLLGVLCAGLGGEAFVRGTVGLARWARVSPGIIGATVAAFATSSPEFAVGVTSALAGTPEYSLGDVLGSNVFNVAFILGVTLLLGDIRGTRQNIRRDFPLALAVPIFIGLLAVDGLISQIDGLLLVASFVIWCTVVSIQAYRQRSAADTVLGEPHHWHAVLFSLVGLGLLVLAGRLIVAGAQGIAAAWGVGAFIIGAVLIAAGTSVPELATTFIAKVRGHDEISLGTILGSNIFNGLWIIGVVAVMHPIPVRWEQLVIALIFGVVTVVGIFPTKHTLIPRWRGVVLLAVYAAYLWTTLTR